MVSAAREEKRLKRRIADAKSEVERKHAQGYYDMWLARGKFRLNHAEGELPSAHEGRH